MPARRSPKGRRRRSRATRSCSRPISASSCTPRATARQPLAAEGGTLLATERLSAGYGALDVIRDIDLAVEKGELVAVLGANGAGKSTLMRALSGLNRPVGGAVLFLGRRIERYSAEPHRRRGAGAGARGPAGVPGAQRHRQHPPRRLRAARRRRRGQAERLLDRFPQLQARRHQRAGLLSGGEQQMLAIARGLIARPAVLMLDEPSLGLAPMLVEGLYDLLAELRDEGTTILLVDQMAALALSVADRAYVLQSGTIRQAGRAAELRADPAVVQAYLGEQERRAETS